MKNDDVKGQEIKEITKLVQENMIENHEALYTMEERYRIAEQNSNELILEYDVNTNSMLFATKRVEELYGIPQNLENAPEFLISSGIVLPESANDFLEIFCMIRTGVPQTQCVVRVKNLCEEELWNEIVLTTIFGRDGRAVKAIGVLRDVTRQMELEMEYQKELRYCEVIKTCALLTYEIDLTHKKMISGLEKNLEPFGVEASKDFDEAIEQILRYLVWEEDSNYIREYFSPKCLLAEYQAGHPKVEREYRRCVEGMPRWVRCTVYLTFDKRQNAVIGYFYIHDIHQLKLEEERFQEATQKDSLTGAYNKETAEFLIRKAMEQELEDGRVSALFLLDLDRFHKINEQMGREFGDAVLSEVAQRLKTQFRSDDIVGRIEKDIFLLFVKNLPDAKAAELRGEGICDMLNHSYGSMAKELHISSSIGFSIAPEDGTTYEALYRKTELALFAAKKQKNQCVRYTEEGICNEGIQGDSLEIPSAPMSEKTFADNIGEYVFQMLYHSGDVEKSIINVLELLSRHMGFSRGYIYESWYDNSVCTNTYEWDGDGIAYLGKRYKVITGSLQKCYQERFSSQTFFMKYEKDALFPEEQGVEEFENLHSRIQFALHTFDQGLCGFVGFDQYYGSRQITGPEVIALQDAIQVLDTFLWKQRMISKLGEQDKMLEAVTKSWKTCTYIIDPDTYMLRFVNNNTRKMLPKAVPGALCYETIRGNTAPCEECPFVNMMCSDSREYRSELYLEPYHSWAKIHAVLIETANGKEFGVFNGYDFSDVKNHSEDPFGEVGAFTGDVALYRALCHSTDDYIFMCDLSKNLFYFPQAMVDDFGLPGKVIEDAIPLWNSFIHENDQEAFLADIASLVEGKSNTHNIEYRVKNKEGNWIWLRCRGYVQRGDGESLFAGVITNLGKKSKIDHLSGLPNKYEFELHVRSQISDCPEGGDILLMGLDNFKNINNLYGWEFGDHVLRESAQKIQEMLPDSIQLYRLDGDCFGVYTSHANEYGVEGVYQMVSRIFAEQQEYEDHRYYCTISGGYASTGIGKVSFQALFKQAEFALEHSKMEGKNRLSHYDVEIMGEKERTLGLIESLRESVDHSCDGFELYFQPQINAKSRVVESAEALLRWKCKDYGMISPGEFIPLLEDAGLIQKVGRWVILKAAEVSREWRKVHPGFTINVNVSYAQLQDKSFIPFIEKSVESGKLLPEAIHMELTESCIATGNQVLRESFEKLRDMGFCMELDDFGTGYSALEILKTAPADVVKIDRTFVTDIVNSSFDATFIQFVVALCHSVDILVCLEGVETWEEYQMVEAMDVDLIQGFLFGRPQSRSDFENKYLCEGGEVTSC